VNRRSLRRALVAPVLAVAALAGAAAPAAAHPLGNFTVNQLSRIEIGGDGVAVTFVLDEAEIPTFQAKSRVDADGDGIISSAETAVERDRLVREIGAALALTVDGAPATLVPGAADLSFPPGQGGLATTRLVARFAATDISLGDAPVRIGFRSEYASDRLGWKDVAIARSDGTAVDATSASVDDPTNGLRVYPTDLLSSPRDRTSADADVRAGDGGIAVASAAPIDAAVATASTGGRSDDRFVRLIDGDGGLTGLGLLGALGLAMLFGMIHALTPGHGKTMVAAYLAGTRGTTKHALALGGTVTVTHTAGVFLLGFVTLSLSQVILPETLYPWLNVISGALVLSIGLYAIRDRLRRRRRTLATAAATGGEEHAHSHAHSHGHSHGGHGHSHDAPADLSWRSLVALGVSGGLLPCPSALVVLLSAVAIHRVALGMLLIVAFSFGLALVISGIGIAVLHARRLFSRLPGDGGRLVPALPVASAIIITGLGVVLTMRSLPGVL